MQATIGCLSRIVSRTLVSQQQQSHGLATSANLVETNKDHARLVTAVSGFPKQSSPYNIDHILKGQIGDDAYFIASHLDDWNSSSTLSTSDSSSPIQSSSSPLISNPQQIPANRNHHQSSVEQLLNPTAGISSSSPMSSTPLREPTSSADVIGVADGVGGWRQYGVDPGQFSMQLMKCCERLVNAGYFVSSQPANLLAQGFSEMQEQKKPVIGSSTACLAMLSHADRKLYTANIGDSGLLVVRDGKVVHRSSEQQHYFNTPYQLSLPPTEMASDVLSDRPEAADRYEFNVEDGDIIILATDGIFDNVPDDLLVEQVDSLRGYTNDQSRIQACANSIALIARSLSRDERFLSPFAKNARASGFEQVIGGKEDDVTVILAAVNCGSKRSFA